MEFSYLFNDTIKRYNKKIKQSTKLTMLNNNRHISKLDEEEQYKISGNEGDEWQWI